MTFVAIGALRVKIEVLLFADLVIFCMLLLIFFEINFF